MSTSKDPEKGEVIVDGTNVIMYAGEPQLRNLYLALERLQSLGHHPFVFFDANTRYDFSEVGELDAGLRKDLTELSEKKQELDRGLEETARSIEDSIWALYRVGADVEVLTEGLAIIWAEKSDMPLVIGGGGKNVGRLEKEHKIKIDVKEKGDEPGGGFGPKTDLFKEVAKVVKRELGRELGGSARLFRTAWHRLSRGEYRWTGWKIVDGEHTYEIRYRRDGNGKKHLAVHDLENGQLKRYVKLLGSSSNMVEVPKGTDADEWILDRAGRHLDAPILSNDGYEDYEDDYPFVRGKSSRLWSFAVVGGEAVIPALEGVETASPEEPEQKKKEPASRKGHFELTDKAGERILPLVGRAEEELTVYSPYISPEYAEMLVEKAEDGVDVEVFTARDGADYHQKSLRLLQAGTGSGGFERELVTREGIGVSLLVIGIVLAAIAYSAYLPAALLSALSFGSAVFLLRSESAPAKKSERGSVALHVLDKLHAKLYLRDGGEEVIYGSANLTRSGMFRNLEVVGGVLE